MKRFYKRSLTLLLTLMLALCAFSLVSCKDEETDETTVAIFPSEEVLALTDSTTLADYLSAMQEKGLLTYEIANGMITSVNGKEQKDAYYWMIYTSDPAQSDATWGEWEYDGKKYASASYGAESLLVKAEYAYILAYHSVSW